MCSTITAYLFYEFEQNHSESALVIFSEDVLLAVECCLPAYGAVMCAHIVAVS